MTTETRGHSDARKRSYIARENWQPLGAGKTQILS